MRAHWLGEPASIDDLPAPSDKHFEYAPPVANPARAHRTEFIRRDDPRWHRVHLRRSQRPKCPSCRFNGEAVRMRVWYEFYIARWKCPSCRFEREIDQERFRDFTATHGRRL